MLRFCCLGSGSEGNALIVEVDDGFTVTRLLIDNGFGLRALARRLARADLALDSLHAIVVTHEHWDHVAGVAALARRRGIAVFASAGTARCAGIAADDIDLRRLRAGETAAIGGVLVTPYAVSHDAAEPLQYVFSDGARRLGLLTDVGAADASVARALDGLDALILECNHDERLLATGDYPPFLKARIASDRGHLSNAQAAELLAALDRSRLRVLVAAHLSRSNNRPDLARAALAAVADCADSDVHVAAQDEGLPWLVA